MIKPQEMEVNKMKIKPSVIIRKFNAPRELVFNTWIQVEHLNKWMFPMQGCQCEFVSADSRDGGTSLYKITMSNGHEMWLFTKREEVSPPEKLVFLQYMSNQAGDILPHPTIARLAKRHARHASL